VLKEKRTSERHPPPASMPTPSTSNRRHPVLLRQHPFRQEDSGAEAARRPLRPVRRRYQQSTSSSIDSCSTTRPANDDIPERVNGCPVFRKVHSHRSASHVVLSTVSRSHRQTTNTLAPWRASRSVTCGQNGIRLTCVPYIYKAYHPN
jgi:hypothetical protein